MTTMTCPLDLMSGPARLTAETVAETHYRLIVNQNLVDMPEAALDLEFEVELAVDTVGERDTQLVGHVTWSRPANRDHGGELWFGVATGYLLWVTTSTAPGAAEKRCAATGVHTRAIETLADEAAETIARFAAGGAL